MSKPPLQFLLAARVPVWEDQRWNDDRRRSFETVHRTAWPRRWARKIRIAVLPALAVFRRQTAQPGVKPASPGTPVLSSNGRTLGTVRSVVVEIESGRSSYAVTPAQPKEDARVLLLPRDLVDHRSDRVVIEEHVLRRLERRSA